MNCQITELRMNRNKLRLWMQGQMLASVGFEPATRYEIEYREGALVLVKCGSGTRAVTGHAKGGRVVPVIDLNSYKVLGMFDGLAHVRVIYTEGEIRITALESERRAKERLERTRARVEAGESLLIGSAAHGGGVLSNAVHEGMTEGGLPVKLAFANEIDHRYLDQSMTFNPVWAKDTIALCGPMQEIAFDQEIMAMLPQLDVFECGLPCDAASLAGRRNRNIVHPEAHEQVGHLVVAYLAIIARTNPTVIVLEQVVPYATTASMDIIRNQLRDLGYELHETVLDAGDWNALEHRKRFVTVGVTKGITFSFDQLSRPAKIERTLGEILDSVPLDDGSWSTMQGLKDKELRDKELGRSFAMQMFDATSPKICTLTAGITRNRSTDAKIQHPENPELLRNPTPAEHARAKDIPPVLVEGLCDTTAHELLGQSICFKPFVAVGKLIAASLKAMRKAVAVDLYDDMPLFRMAA